MLEFNSVKTPNRRPYRKMGGSDSWGLEFRTTRLTVHSRNNGSRRETFGTLSTLHSRVFTFPLPYSSIIGRSEKGRVGLEFSWPTALR